MKTNMHRNAHRIKTHTVWSIRWLFITPFGTHRIRKAHTHIHPIHAHTFKTDEIELNERLYELHCREPLAGGQLRVCSTQAMFMRHGSHALANARAHFGWPFFNCSHRRFDQPECNMPESRSIPNSYIYMSHLSSRNNDEPNINRARWIYGHIEPIEPIGIFNACGPHLID